MDLQQTLTALANTDGHYQREAVSEALLRRDEVTPALLDILEEVVRDPEPYIQDHRRFDHIYAMYLLAQFRETRAYPLLLTIFSTPGEFAFDLVDDVVTEGLGKILASVSGGDIGGMTELTENEKTNEFVRAAGLTGLVTLCGCGSLSRDQLVAYFKGLFQKLKRTSDDVWGWLANSCADIWPAEVMEDIRKAYDDDLIDPRMIGWDDVERALALGEEAAMAKLRRNNTLVSDVHKELSWWYCFRENQKPSVRDNLLTPREFSRPDPAVFNPIYRAEPKVGRNEPCPCGTGKKFKKCCGR
ncbi:MAG TPA: DUF1186 domain-containing protein [Terriglobales bacterium]|jgi:hypothetical protein